MTYFFILFAAVLIVVLSFVFYHPRKLEKEQGILKKIPDIQPSVAISSQSIHSITARAGMESSGFHGNEQKAPSFKKHNLLIVDDQYAIRMMLSELFIAQGMVVFEAANGDAALEICRNQVLDCILLDLKLPDMDGIEILREIRSLTVDVPVVLLTAYAAPEKMEDALTLGISHCFTKPFDIIELRVEIMRIINNHHSQADE
ncbi:response regulator [Paenibacillus sp. LHD-38]|uniref:response regulator n=1 Tax=Paenibacillus sp. LHD-38 TaxID=3072143 RepID=UPI00280EE9EE|nr:response regulator [Paenibacillus sp. LHD-38]MDQ8733706.1 response regulator [Paenibacillus sp. LHD-38]